MSTLEKDGLKDCLFSRQDKRLINIKFMRGNAKVIAADDLRTEVRSILQQRAHGLTPSGAAKSGKAPIDVRNLVANL